MTKMVYSLKAGQTKMSKIVRSMNVMGQEILQNLLVIQWIKCTKLVKQAMNTIIVEI